MEARIARILDRVRAKRLKLHPVLTEEAIREFEHRHGIELPAGYRLFLNSVGDGGAGPPYYGLARLGDASDDMRPEEQDLWRKLPLVREPFPFTHAWVWEAGEASDEGGEADVDRGTIYLGNDGCGMYWHLVVTGPDRGIPWQLTGEGIQPVCPKCGFLEWYEDWLDGKDPFRDYRHPQGA